VNERGAFSPAEAAAWLGISKTQVYRLIKAGELRARRCGTRILVSRKALEEYLDGDAALIRSRSNEEGAHLVGERQPERSANVPNSTSVPNDAPPL
jgi:excisionase family DNA binding protein